MVVPDNIHLSAVIDKVRYTSLVGSIYYIIYCIGQGLIPFLVELYLLHRVRPDKVYLYPLTRWQLRYRARSSCCINNRLQGAWWKGGNEEMGHLAATAYFHPNGIISGPRKPAPGLPDEGHTLNGVLHRGNGFLLLPPGLLREQLGYLRQVVAIACQVAAVRFFPEGAGLFVAAFG